MVNFKQRWESLDPGRKKKYMMLFAVIILFMFALLSTKLTGKKDTRQQMDDSVEVDVMVPNRRDATLEELSAQQMASTRKLRRLEDQIQTTQKLFETKIQELISQMNVSQDLDQTREVKNDIDYLTNRLKRIESQLAQQTNVAAKNSGGTIPRPQKIDIPSLTPTGQPSGADNQVEIPGMASETGSANASTPGQGGFANEPPAFPGSTDQEIPPPETRFPLRVVSGGSRFTANGNEEPGAENTDQAYSSLPGAGLPPRGVSQVGDNYGGGITDRAAKDLAKEIKRPKDVYLPSGSMFSGVLLNGLDAVTSNANRRNPTPVSIRVKRDAILPNYYSLQIRECFVTAGGYGDMSIERAIMRTERISCVRDDGGVIDAPLDGYIVGEDGKVGLRGRLIMRQGSLLTRSAIAGLLSGFSKALEPQGVTGITIGVPGASGNATPATKYSTPDVMQAGVLGGVSSASEKVAEFYLDLVDQIKPTIEVDAGRKATIIVVKGTTLKLG
ncbi:TrbI/VirB10 family protein [Thiolapillus sp.]|nr:TrbI/VirB10 family protein [Thiolapillus sp.]